MAMATVAECDCPLSGGRRVAVAMRPRPVDNSGLDLSEYLDRAGAR
jgi:hypothetical protein